MFGSIFFCIVLRERCLSHLSGDDACVVPPVPFPNTEVKHAKADSTWLETAWEGRLLPVYKKHSPRRVLFSLPIFGALALRHVKINFLR